MTAVISTIYMGVGWLSTLVAFGNNLICDPLSQPIIKDKVLSTEFYSQALFLYLVGIIDNTTFKVKYVSKSLVQHISTGLLTANTAGTVHNNVFVLCVFQHIGSHR